MYGINTFTLTVIAVMGRDVNTIKIKINYIPIPIMCHHS